MFHSRKARAFVVDHGTPGWAHFRRVPETPTIRSTPLASASFVTAAQVATETFFVMFREDSAISALISSPSGQTWQD